MIADSPNANGFYAAASHNGTFSNNQVNDIGDVGCYIDDGDNWTIAENTVQITADIGISVIGSNAQVYGNEVSDTEAEGIYVVPGHDSWIARNNVTNAESTAIVTDGNRAVVEGNTITDCEQGITINNGDNVTIANNTVSSYGFMGGIDIVQHQSCSTTKYPEPCGESQFSWWKMEHSQTTQ
jgi:parallel beta-helix repeat protein